RALAPRATPRAEKVAYAPTVLATVATVRSSLGLPHWLVVDEAHHVFPAEGSPAAELLGPGAGSVVRVRLAAGGLGARARAPRRRGRLGACGGVQGRGPDRAGHARRRRRRGHR